MKLRRTSTDSSLPGRDGAFWLGGGEKTADAHARTCKQNIHTDTQAHLSVCGACMIAITCAYVGINMR